MVDDIGSNPLSLNAVESARERAWRDGCVLVVIPIHGDKDLERHAIELLTAQRLVGIVSMGDLAVYATDDRLAGEVAEAVSEPADIRR